MKKQDDRLGPGDQIGAYRVIGAPGPGGAYRAVHISLPRRVLLEVRLADDWRPVVVQTMRAASILESLHHPGIARILEHGVLPDRRTWLVSELPDGIPLSEIMLRRRLSADEVAGLVRDVGEILAYAHARDVVHGNVRPHGITYTTGSRAFPISLGEWSNLRAPGVPDDEDLCLGAYAAPETSQGIVDGRVDVFALGVLAYRAATGKFPGVLTPELVAGVPGKLGALITRMLAGDRKLRPTAAEVLAIASELTNVAPVVDRAPADRSSGPRFAQPRWTPAPDFAAETASPLLPGVGAGRRG